MPKIKDMTGLRFGSLVVLDLAEKKPPSNHARWRCRCDCGTIFTVAGTDLRTGNTTSCGCMKIAGLIKRRFKDLTGKRFGRLVVLGRVKSTTTNKTSWQCRCDCGNLKVASGSSLQAGYVSSCGCLQSEVSRKLRLKHGQTGTSLYNIWKAMLQRCHNSNNVQYPDYGGRGIIVCTRWRDSFENFREDMGDRPKGMTLDRRDNNKGYSPDNCRWITQREQCLNRRNTSLLTISGVTGPLVKAAMIFGVPEATLRAHCSSHSPELLEPYLKKKCGDAYPELLRKWLNYAEVA